MVTFLYMFCLDFAHDRELYYLRVDSFLLSVHCVTCVKMHSRQGSQIDIKIYITPSCWYILLILLKLIGFPLSNWSYEYLLTSIFCCLLLLSPISIQYKCFTLILLLLYIKCWLYIYFFGINKEKPCKIRLFSSKQEF